MEKNYITINQVIESLEQEIRKSDSKNRTFNIEGITLDLAAEIVNDYDNQFNEIKTINILRPEDSNDSRLVHRISITLTPNTEDSYVKVRLSDLD